MASTTADVHCYDVLTNKWSTITPFGEQLTQSAAHAATAVGTVVIIQLVCLLRIFMFLISHNNSRDGID
ncbi:Kelch-type beta propeller [Parasponia andersonii]|uniref:Kelch-type beta propeller n=1 Tax=Parasponia andersonii TaxID=3476 RepID=A0A2P5DRZ9_PARAD|nr:Kelch-type beta propeller [Parasponia andersonii]